MLKAECLTKKYGPVTACADISFSLAAGEITALAGINGAGKSTLMKMISGVLMPDSGRCFVGDFDMRVFPVESRRIIGTIFEDTPLYQDMSVRSHLSFSASVHGLSRSATTSAVNRMLDTCDLSLVANQQVGTLSKGVRQRLALALAIVHDPGILVLDEPSSGLDPVQISLFRSIMLSLKNQGKTILISTHIMQEVESLCDRILVLDSGTLKADLSLDAFRNASQSHTLEDSFLSLIGREGKTPS
jgi:ABC-2 type transport system ATP-binding protein